jgi:alanine racemase
MSMDLTILSNRLSETVTVGREICLLGREIRDGICKIADSLETIVKKAEEEEYCEEAEIEE